MTQKWDEDIWAALRRPATGDLEHGNFREAIRLLLLKAREHEQMIALLKGYAGLADSIEELET